ncbi:unnamed protein product [Timema podura]|uniref:Uncharacterized protein n=1 Tax=Timema podura TaxID=61482 RepID=A0ABN7NE12_TIMPD|nr:unnamed protein product [Timema podura]
MKNFKENVNEFACRELSEALSKNSPSVRSARIQASTSRSPANRSLTLTVDSNVHQKLSAEQKRGHVMSFKPTTRFLPHRRELFCISTSSSLPEMLNTVWRLPLRGFCGSGEGCQVNNPIGWFDVIAIHPELSIHSDLQLVSDNCTIR